ncbi:ornithine cyclodeaminase family protein [Puniceibacterium sp. IMCC21224]|uniref:ornithine cyclodeaminase family protein n=1 Tax=Puniceibacterium sp. IMCC21224 TaxID=1618204 RepID=UPI00065D2B8E|nr:ornithine cyclodeaminase family protein [Puniceibacterium sp. IMCC21224]KMK65001.1 putative ornithine cyclodeaminase, mu-crystallin [Puniceibacterium sp. IMCC21224]
MARFWGEIMLLIDNETVHKLLTMRDTMAALEQSYLGVARGTVACRPRIDVNLPTSDPDRMYRWGTMEGGSAGGYFAIRMKSDVIYHQTAPDGTRTQEKYCGHPGQFCGIIFLIDAETGLPLAFINDGNLQHMRVGGDGGIGVKYMAREGAEVVGMLGSGGMADTHMLSFIEARPTIRKLRVFSPTQANRDAFAARMAERHGIETVVCDSPEQIYRGADIVAALTDAAQPVLNGDLLERGTHVVNIGGGGLPDTRTLERVDTYLRMGDAPAPDGHETLDDEYLAWRPRAPGATVGNKKRAHGNMLPDKRVTLDELIRGEKPGRTSDAQITWSERGNLQGAQFYAVAARVYEAARAANLGHELPDEWFLQNIRN